MGVGGGSRGIGVRFHAMSTVLPPKSLGGNEISDETPRNECL